MNLFQTGYFTLHGGGFSNFKIDCDALTDGDLRTIGLQIAQRVSGFYEVVGVPRGGLRLAEAMEKYKDPFQPIRCDKILIVDDVFTTGASMEEYRNYQGSTSRIIGAVIFARNDTPDWITPLFRMTP